MESLDILNYFLHDKIAAKMWKRTLDHVNDNLMVYEYLSTNDKTRTFELIWCPSNGNLWISECQSGKGKSFTIFCEDISSIYSGKYALTFNIGLYSNMSILYGHRS